MEPPLIGMTLRQLLQAPADLDRILTQEEVEHIFGLCEALWIHNGDPTAPHAELTSGNCSNGYINTGAVLKHSRLAMMLGNQLMRKVRQAYEGPVDWVVGSDHAAATISFAVAVAFGARHDFTEKGNSAVKMQKWERHQIERGEIVLIAEELITTLETMERVMEGIRRDNPTSVEFTHVVATLVDRAKVHEIERRPIVSLVRYDIQTWKPAECPLCRQGSERVRPKHNWARLTERRAA